MAPDGSFHCKLGEQVCGDAVTEMEMKMWNDENEGTRIWRARCVEKEEMEMKTTEDTFGGRMVDSEDTAME